jgi:hypothetical protein
MPEAVDFQRAFAAMLADPGGVADTALRRALTIHRNTATKAARDALFANFPVAAALVGQDAFAACASAYVAVSPLCLYGDRFAAFVEGWDAFASAPYLGAVAAVERLVIEALFAADAPPLDPGALAQGLDPEAALCRHPATRTLATPFPAGSLWLAHQGDLGADELADALDSLVWQAEGLLITRPADAVEVRVIDAPTRAFLAGTTLADAAMRAADAGGDVAPIFAALLGAGAFCAQPISQDIQGDRP